MAKAKTDYESRLRLSIEGDDKTEFFSKSGELLCIGYKRVVIGERGPYVEFDTLQVQPGVFTQPPDGDKHYYYIEMRSARDDVKLYLQAFRVDYADYVPLMAYISPFDMYDASGEAYITPLRESNR